MIYVLGGRGRLGRAIEAARVSGEVTLLERAEYENWWQSDAVSRVARFFDGAPPGSAVLVAAGLLDPSLPGPEHQRVNVELPSRVVEGACKAGLRAVTFGTVMERLPDPPNAYIATKAALGRVVAERAAAGDAVTHLQLHTLYGGGEPAPFMFLGQVVRALREQRSFEMSPGRQLREYHHVDDDAVAALAVLDAGVGGVVALSHGAPFTLRELASHVFAELGKKELLHIGALPEPRNDNYGTVVPRPKLLDHLDFRPTLEGVAAYLRALLTQQQRV
ncbi:NAD-dependent epimerase/dehydratase family protein [Variovorax sp. J31P179]|uniref:NAD-dependent epimerase/dehydratase family protein n=1 Tax=Variovorax sp. J31P179 TaxID=3053508 RepID=UPI002574ACC4|nr:NAD-dependent epimerase/dehydratase family protein [Variovorax sp. J31P179]MDM0081988.1 NAD-dependent epimerase/dehydratase family protein [Variovorax sp. J31P179]